MQILRVSIRVVLYREEESWIAHCLEFDLIGDGETQEQALQQLSNAIQIQMEASLEYRHLANLFSPAEGEYFRIFAAGEDVATPEKSLDFEPLDHITIDNVLLRQFLEAESAAV